MKFLIVTFAPTIEKNGKIYSYGPYVKEMNIWAKSMKQVAICSPTTFDKTLLLDEFNFKIKQFKLLPFAVISCKDIAKSLYIIPYNFFVIFKAMLWANHIHLRCPGNVGLLGCIVQILFPSKPKTAKYAGNWDPESRQPVTYKFQKWLLSNTFLTKKMKVLVYGQWPNQSQNILPFFTASYHQNEIIEVPKKELINQIKLIYVGGLTVGKQPLLSVQSAHEFIKKGYNIHLDMYGDGVMRNEIENYISTHQLDKQIILHGNVNKDEVKKAFINAHFLIFISKSEGWPKVVAEAMFWGCLPISSDVSCVHYMLGNNNRGSVLKLDANTDDIVTEIKNYLEDEKKYQKKVLEAKKWSQNYTLDTFEKSIKELLKHE
jgi:glycosyltransferase involved in cell wall biosynthesis